jgi:hypothetical protein
MNSEILGNIERLAILNMNENSSPKLFNEDSIKEREEIVHYLKINNVLETNGNGELHFIGEHSDKYNYLYMRRYSGL